MKIRHKLIVSFAGVALLVAIVGFLSIRVSQKVLQKEIENECIDIASEYLAGINRHIYMRIESLQAYCTDVIAQRVVSESNEEFGKIGDIQALIEKRDSQWMSAPAEETTPLMQELQSNELAGELKEKIEFYERKYEYKVFGEIFITNKYGVNIGQSQRTSDYYQGDEKWWQETKEKGLFVSDVGYDESADINSIDICLAIADEAGDFIGVIKAVLNIKDTYTFLGEKQQIEFKLLTDDSRVIYSTCKYEFLENLSKDAVFGVLLDQNNNSAIISGCNEYEDKAKLLVHVHSQGYKDFGGLGWALVVEYDLEEVFASVTMQKNWLLIISSAVTVLSILLGLFISRSISVPLNKLVFAAARIGKGDLESLIEIDSTDEIGQLAESLNKMVEDLKTSTTSIDHLNAVNQQLQASQQQLDASNHELQTENSERRRAEKDLVSVNDILEGTIEKLAQSNVELQDFVYIASHDLREPLRKISSFGELLQDSLGEGLGEDDKENLDFMIDGAMRMTQMIEALLVYSRLNTNDITLSTVDLNEVIEQFSQLELATLLEETNATIDVPETLPTVRADETLIRQLIQNLIINGIKYQEPGGSPRIEITAREIDNGKVRIEFKDNGIGIKEEMHQAIFKMFKRVHSSKEYQGAGIGLAVCKKIAERHNSQIGVDSEQGEGSVFWFTMELAKEPATVS